MNPLRPLRPLTSLALCAVALLAATVSANPLPTAVFDFQAGERGLDKTGA